MSKGGSVTDDLQVDVDYFRRRVGGEILAGSMSEYWTVGMSKPFEAQEGKQEAATNREKLLLSLRLSFLISKWK